MLVVMLSIGAMRRPAMVHRANSPQSDEILSYMAMCGYADVSSISPERVEEYCNAEQQEAVRDLAPEAPISVCLTSLIG